MKIEELPKTPEEITITEKDLEPTKEDKEQVEKFLKGMFVRKNKYHFKNIAFLNKPVEDIKQDIINKTSPLSKAQRDLIMEYETDFMQDCLNYYKSL